MTKHGSIAHRITKSTGSSTRGSGTAVRRIELEGTDLTAMSIARDVDRLVPTCHEQVNDLDHAGIRRQLDDAQARFIPPPGAQWTR